MLENDQTNILIVARHLSDLRDIDYKGVNDLTDEQLGVVASRYNRGPDLSLGDIKKNTSYGDLINKKTDDLNELLKK